MHNFPQEIVNLVIDMLAQVLGYPEDRGFELPDPISNYSTVCYQWVERTQYYHFKTLRLDGQLDLEKWGAAIGKGPLKSRVSRHVEILFLKGIKTLQGFEEHFTAFTNVTEAIFSDCDIFFSLEDVLLLEPLGSLLKLNILKSRFSPALLVKFLAFFPNLELLFVRNLLPHPYIDFEVSHPTIPFFEKAKDFTFHSDYGYSSDTLGWIPPTARFSMLTIGASSVRDNPEAVHTWIVSSSETLKCLAFVSDWDNDGACSSVSGGALPLLTMFACRFRSRFLGHHGVQIP